MAEKKPQDSVVKAVGKAGGYDALVKIGEATIDAFLDEGLVRDIPILGTLVGIGKAGVAVRDVLLVRKLQAFLHELEDVAEEREKFVSEMDADPAQRDKVGMHLLTLLDRFEDIEKAQFLGRAFRLFLKQGITSHSGWGFICATDGTWTWRSATGFSECFQDLYEATADATQYGFNPFIHYWTATAEGRTAHYRPGKTPVNLPAGKDPRER